MATAQKLVVGSPVWTEDPEIAWKEGRVAAVLGNEVAVDTDEGTVTVRADSCYPRDDEEGATADDMTKLSYLNEPAVLNNLHRRYQSKTIYTYTGSILIALNPFTTLPGLYSEAMKQQYRGARLGTVAPHVFAIADNAYRLMMEEKRSQSVLISGESGAGKTETTKLIMEHLAFVGGRGALQGRPSIEQQVLESNPLLEAFGNAKTVRNNNSSRFGKFIEIQFDKKGQVSGAAVRSYLLERSRVVNISSPERNYHCFYQLCDGASPEEVAKYMLPLGPDRGRAFHYLNQSDCFQLDSKHKNEEEYLNTRRAMRIMGISQEDQESIFGVIAAILHLGNVEYAPGPNDELVLASEASEHHLDAVARLLKCDREKLSESILTRTIVTHNDVIKKSLELPDVIAKRDTLAKTIYSRLFDWIVRKVNSALGQDPDSVLMVGVLDIYGFEHFEVNSFEQFCINLANEKLQQHFNKHVLMQEQVEYEEEKINWSYITFVDNKDVLDLIENQGGILSILDEASLLKVATPRSFASKLYENFGNHPRFSRTRFSRTDFSIEHYAGKVTYLADEFLTKNADLVVLEHQELLGKSLSSFVRELFPPPPEVAETRQRSRNVSIGRRFKQELGALMETLTKTDPHYIRCVKPNSASQPNAFDNLLTLQQLRSGGVLEAVRISSAGYPTRRLFANFVDRFDILVPGLRYGDLEDREAVLEILKAANLSNYQLGETKVFLRAGQLLHLDSLRLDIMNAAATRIQRATRAYLHRLRRDRAAIVIQKHWRGYKARVAYQQARAVWAAIIIQKHVRCHLAYVHYSLLRWAAIVVQSYARSARAKRQVAALRRQIRAATTIQKMWRGLTARRLVKELRRHKKEAVKQPNSVTDKEEEALPNSAVIKFQLLVALRQKDKAVAKVEQQRREIAELQLALRNMRRLSPAAIAACNKWLPHRPFASSSPPSVAEETPEDPSLTSSDTPPGDLLDATSLAPKPATVMAAQVAEEGSRPGRPGFSSIPSLVIPQRGEVGGSTLPSPASNPLSDIRWIPSQGPSGRSPSAESAPGGIGGQRAAEQVPRRLYLEALARAERAEVALKASAAAQAQVLEESQQRTRQAEERQAAMQEKLKQREDELATLTQRFLTTMPAQSPKMPISQQLEVLLQKLTARELGFSREGHPVAATLMYRALLHWGAFTHDKKSSAFDRVVETIQMTARQEARDPMAYWLSNTSGLYFLVANGYKPDESRNFSSFSSFFSRTPSKVHAFPTLGSNMPADVVLFKQQLAFSVERLYLTLRDVIRRDILASLEGKETKLQRTSSLARRQGGRFWSELLFGLQQLDATLLANYVPSLLANQMLAQLVFSINVAIFNGLILRTQWCPCTYSNAETIADGILRLDRWLSQRESELAQELGSDLVSMRGRLAHLRQAVKLLLVDHKQEKKADALQVLCPSLSMKQMAHLCHCYEDDEYGTKGFNMDIVTLMLESMTENTPLILLEDTRIPFTLDELCQTMKEYDIADVLPPDSLLESEEFNFLLPRGGGASIRKSPSSKLSFTYGGHERSWSLSRTFEH